MKKEKRIEIWEKYNGHCAYCGKVLEYKDMQVDHMFPKGFGGTNDFTNLMPSCRRCNHYKRAETIERFKITISTLHERILKNYINKVGVDYGIIEVKKWSGKFYFERK